MAFYSYGKEIPMTLAFYCSPLLMKSSSTETRHLFAALVNLGQESFKHALLEPLGLINLADPLPDLSDKLLLIILVALLKLEIVIQLLDDRLLGLVLAAVVLLEDLALVGGDNGKSLVYEPGALVVHDVGADLANVLGKSKVVEVVVLDLEVLTQRDEDGLGLLEVGGGGDVEEEQRESDGEVEGVIGRLVDDDEAVLLHGEVVEVDDVLGGGEEVAELAHLGLEGDLVEELEEVDVAGVVAEVLLEEGVDGRLEHESVVDGDHADALVAVPAGLAAAGDGRVHDVVRDEEEGLEELGHPAEGGRLEVLIFGEGSAEEEGDGVGDRHAAVALAADGIDLEGLGGKAC